MPKKPAAPEPESCGTCKYAQPNQNDEYGYCRRSPPVPAVAEGATIMLWRIVAMSEWCGEYRRRLDS